MNLLGNLDTPIPYDEGKHNLWAWDMLIVYLLPGAILNLIQALLHIFIPELRKQSVSTIIIWISFIDFTFDFVCSIQCILNRAYEKFFGRETLCVAQAIWAEWLMGSSFLIVSSLMYASYSAIVNSEVPSTTKINKLLTIIVLYCLVLSIITNSFSMNHELNTSGLYCYSVGGRLLEGLLFHIFYVLPVLGTLTYFYIKIRNKVTSLTKYLVERGAIDAGPRVAQVNQAKRMAFYIIAFLIVVIPFEITFAYSWITGNHAPATLWIVAAFFGHLLTFLSPILYYILNSRAREILWKKLRCLPVDGTIPNNGSRASEINFKSSRIVAMLNNEKAFTDFLAFTKRQHCPELLLFWRDVRQWKKHVQELLPLSNPDPSPKPDPNFDPDASPPPFQLGEAALLRDSNIELSFLSGERKTIQSPLDQEGKEDDDSYPSSPSLSPLPTPVRTSSPSPIRSSSPEIMTKERYIDLAIRPSTLKIYELYIAHSAPWEINISAEVKNGITDRLKISHEHDIYVCNVILDRNTITIFDKALDEVILLLGTDVFPRYLSEPGVGDVYRSGRKALETFGDVLPPSPKKPEKKEEGKEGRSFSQKTRQSDDVYRSQIEITIDNINNNNLSA